jgi:hypothetical protein
VQTERGEGLHGSRAPVLKFESFGIPKGSRAGSAQTRTLERWVRQPLQLAASSEWLPIYNRTTSRGDAGRASAVDKYHAASRPDREPTVLELPGKDLLTDSGNSD